MLLYCITSLIKFIWVSKECNYALRFLYYVPSKHFKLKLINKFEVPDPLDPLKVIPIASLAFHSWQLSLHKTTHSLLQCWETWLEIHITIFLNLCLLSVFKQNHCCALLAPFGKTKYKKNEKENIVWKRLSWIVWHLQLGLAYRKESINVSSA